jgi:hypothetical protein
MREKKILVICNSFWPDINPRAFRATELVKEFSRQSHEVIVMKPNVSNTQLDFAHSNGFDFIDIGNLNLKPLIKNQGKISNLIGRVVNRLLQLFFEYPYIKLCYLVRKAIIKSKNEFDLCFSIAVPYPIHWGTAAGLAKNKIAKTWIADCGDPFMGDESDSFRHPFYFKYIEKYFCKRADYLTVPTSESNLGYYEELLYRDDMIIYVNILFMCVFDEYKIKKTNNLIELLRINKDKVIINVYNHG